MQRKDWEKNEQSIRDRWECNRSNICIIGTPEEKMKEVGAKKVFRHIMGENFPNLAEINL